MTSKKKTIGGSRDLISQLTDELICHILSFLPTKEAASTSVLSKRWKPKTPLLAFVPNLYFDNSKNFNLPMTNAKREEKIESFKRFVNNVLVLQGEVKAPLKTFNVKCKDVEIYLVIDWIRKVLERGVSDIDISTSSYRGRSSSLSFYHLPSEIFVSKTLVRLKIDFVSGVKISVEGDVSLPKLKTLHLDYFQIGTRMFNKLLSGCLVLEELLLDNLKWDSNESKPCSVIISVPTLQRLSFSRYEDEESDDDEEFHEVIPSVPISFDNSNLVYLEYYDTIAAGYENVRFDSLVEASLGLRRTSFPDKMNVTKVLIGICNVKILYLSYGTLKALVCCCETIPVFDNLVQLTIETAQYVGWKPLPFLLKNCPNLETLVFEGLHHKYTDYRCNDQGGCLCEGQDNLMVKPEVDACFSSSSVKVVKILQFGEITDDSEYIDDQIEHVKNLLATMPNLEQMILYYTTPYDEDVMDLFEQLQELPRIAAAECNVKIISDEFDLSFTMSA